MKKDTSESPATLYEPRGQSGDNLFGPVLLLSVLAFLGLGMYMHTRPAPDPKRASGDRERIETSFIVPEEKPKPEPPTPPKPKPKPKKQEPVDLTDNPKTRQKEDVKIEKQPDQESSRKKKKARPVYGIKKVYSRGIGSSGSAGDAVIGKLGNTLDKSIDSDTATPQDLQGEVVSTTTIDRVPQYKRKPRPEYSPQMLENEIEGVVKVKCLIDIDGKVKRAIPLNDLGYDSKVLARKACMEALFDPALRDGNPVAVWIIVPIRFTILG